MDCQWEGYLPAFIKVLYFCYIVMTLCDITYQKFVRHGKLQTASVTLSAPLSLIEFECKLSKQENINDVTFVQCGPLQPGDN